MTLFLSEEVNVCQDVADGGGYHHEMPYHVGELELLTGVEEQAHCVDGGTCEEEPEAGSRCSLVERL